MRIVFLGPPGAGKGTQAARVAASLGVPHLSTGDMLRVAKQEGTEVGLKAKAFMETGQLVPDKVVDELVRERLGAPDCAQGFLLDGYPRNQAQARALETHLQTGALDYVISLQVDDEKLVARIAGRRTCPKDNSVYHMATRPPRRPGLCDLCGTELVQRADDREEVVRDRLCVYHEATAGLVGYYERAGLVHTVDGDRSIEQVAAAVRAALSIDDDRSENAA
ncbi:MAG: adenylate kinase [Planctomycetota bacterium]|nr:adenylate kinase [Planctomycetota bacterium]